MPDCKCTKCVDMCKHRPCWGTPEEIEAIIEAGFGHKLMLDYWAQDSELPHIDIVSPAIMGRGGRNGPFFPMGRCTFLTDDGLCELHDLGLKPVEGRLAMHDNTDELQELHKQTAKSWDSKKGYEVVSLWRNI